MADIFISYSKRDHALALKLSAFLEAEGWTVWWDKSLAAADPYRDEIMKQLAAARAVITIWSPNSVRSDWVRAEAGKAKADGKLIPVKTPDVAYADIPLPFGEMHTENLEASQLIRAAVVAQLAKPAVEPSAPALLIKGVRYELLTWWGIIGGAVTLFAAISNFIKLADWARLLVQNWKEWTHAFWVWAFGWLGIHLPPEWTPVLSFLLFGSLLTIGQAVKFRNTIKPQPIADKYQGKSFQLISWQVFFCLGYMLIVSLVWLSLRWATVLSPPEWWDKYRYLPVLFTAVAFLVPLIMIMFARHRLHAAVAILLMVIFWTIITLNNLASNLSVNYTAFAMMWALPLILLSVAPAKDVSRRLIFLALGLILLMSLNELSKLGLDVTAPKLQG